MNKTDKSETIFLRQKAEEILKKKPLKSCPQLSEAETLKLIHELEVHKIELELQNEELRLATSAARDATELYDFAPSGYFTLSKEGKIVKLNLCGATMLGKELAHLKNSRFGFFVSDNTKLIFNIFLRKVFNGNAKETCEVTLSANLNLPMHVHLAGIAAENGKQCFLVATDITGRKSEEESVAALALRYQTLLQMASDGIYVLDDQGHIVGANAAFCDMLGYKREELLLLNVADWDPQLLGVDIMTKVGDITKFHTMHEALHRRKDGTFINVEINIKSINLEGRYYLYGSARNITDRKRMEAEILLKNEALIKLNTEKDKLFSIIAHDLRSPFNGFLGLTEMMVKELPSMTMNEIHEIALVMRTSATNLFSLLGNLLEWSLMQRGITSFATTSFLLMPKISESMVYVLEAANKKEISINYHVPGDLSVFGDENMLRGIIRNLVFNAVKFTPRGGIVTVSANLISNSWIEISIKDTGIGMSKNMIDNLFRLDENTNRKGTEGEYSSGLGLVLCKDFIEKHGGKLWIESEEGEGSTFHFTMPAIRDISGKEKC